PEGAVENALVLPYGAPESLAKIEEEIDEIAAVLVEPVQSRNPELFPVSFLRELRRLTEASGAALVFDEMITGFRAHPGGIQAELGIRSDLATYGKVLGGAFPIGVVAGSARYMDCLDGGRWRYGDESEPESDLTYFAATYVRHPLALAAANAVLDHLAEEGPDLQRRLNDRTQELVRELRQTLDRIGAAIQVPSYSSWFRLAFPPEVHHEGGSSLFFYHLLDEGIHVYSPDQNFFLSTAHGDSDLSKLVSAVETSARELQGGGFLPIPAVPVTPTTRLPLTPAQFEIWYASQMGPVASTAYNESFTLELEGELDLALFRSSLSEVLSRHDALRLRFGADGEEQEIDRESAFELELHETTGTAALDEIRRLEAGTPFDLEKAPLVRLHLLRFEDRRHAFIMTAHHAVFDGWSAGLLLDELGRTYSARRGGKVPELGAPVRFEDYLAWEREQESGEEGESARKYWSHELGGKPPLLDLPLDRPHPPARSFRGATVRQELDPALLTMCRDAAVQKRTTPFVLLLTAFESLLYRLTGETDFTVGLLVGGQVLSGMEALVGHCAKLVPVRSRIEEAMTFASLLENTRTKVLDAGTHHGCSYGRMLQGLNVERSTGRLPLVEVAFNMDRHIPCRLEGLKARFSLNPKAAVHFDLFFNLTEGDGSLTIDCDYNRDIFDEETVRRWMGHYVTLVSGAIASLDVRLRDLPLLSAAEARLLVSAGDATIPVRRGAETVQALFETQARRDPDRVALIDPDGALTYRELHHRARRVAQGLRRRGIGPGSIVGLLVDRSSWMVAGLLGILETGAAYLPIAPDWPDDRMRFVLSDAGADLLLSDDPSPIPDSRTPVARIDEDLENVALGELPMPRCDPDSLAYVIYTSGSTGRPKGVEVPHRAVVNLLESMVQRPGFGAEDRLLAVTTIGFDIAALEIFLPLSLGGTVILVSRPVASHGPQLRWTIWETQPTMLQATPSTWRLLIDSGWDGTQPLKVLCGGETLPRDLRDSLLERSDRVWNLYGPTETTIWSSCARLSRPNEPVVIGRPIASTELYVVDRFETFAPPGVPGELYIGGRGLARGYRNRPELTAERFVPDWLGGEPGGRLYRTGDVARYRSDGEVEYL
ncbi:MAG TPA: amino acid adenylation domain-containing protein, partial [Vicinamibacteria bacterium]